MISEQERKMSKILYIKASPMNELSFSTAVAEAFLETYQQQNPKDKIQTIDLFDEDLPPFNWAAASAKYKIMHGKEHSEQDRKIWSKVEDIINEFKSADKYVFAVPMWNFSIPYRLKQYIDILVQPTYTFGMTEDGNYKGLVGDKPVFVAYARGGRYLDNPQAQDADMQIKYLELILGFVGLTNTQKIVVEPTLAEGPETANEKKQQAIQAARELAKKF